MKLIFSRCRNAKGNAVSFRMHLYADIWKIIDIFANMQTRSTHWSNRKFNNAIYAYVLINLLRLILTQWDEWTANTKEQNKKKSLVIYERCPWGMRNAHKDEPFNKLRCGSVYEPTPKINPKRKLHHHDRHTTRHFRRCVAYEKRKDRFRIHLPCAPRYSQPMCLQQKSRKELLSVGTLGKKVYMGGPLRFRDRG